MASHMIVFVAICLTVFSPVLVAGDGCQSPTVSHQAYTTREAITSRETVFLVEFQLQCKNNLNNPFLYADVGGRQLPISRSGDNQYQVSWTEEHKKASSGNYEINLFDEEGFSALRKAQRAGLDVSEVTPLTTITFNHAGVSKGSYISSEVVALLVAFLVWYAAYNTKKTITE